MPELVLVRHGETVGQSSIRLYGATDVALAPEGEEQVRAAGPKLPRARFDAVFTSPLSRAWRSTEVLLETIAHPPIAVHHVEDFREIDFGRWEGWTWDEVRERDPEGLARRQREGFAFTFPEGEARRAFVERVQAGVDPHLGAAFQGGAQRVLAVLHKGVIKAICAHLLRLPFIELDGLEVPLGAVRHMRLDAAAARWQLEFVAGDRRPRNIQAATHEAESEQEPRS